MDLFHIGHWPACVALPYGWLWRGWSPFLGPPIRLAEGGASVRLAVARWPAACEPPVLSTGGGAPSKYGHVGQKHGTVA